MYTEAKIWEYAGDVVEYFIASNEVMWDYTPKMMDMCGDKPQAFDDDASGILVPSNLSMVVGHKQLKALFEEYTDNTFTTKKVSTGNPQHAD